MPRWISRNVDSVSPMSYPVLYGGGELGLASPSPSPARPCSGRWTTSAARCKAPAPNSCRGCRTGTTPGTGARTDRCGPAPGRQGISALERLRALHEGRAGTRRHQARGVARPSRPDAAYGPSPHGASRAVAPLVADAGRAAGRPSLPELDRGRRRCDIRPRTAAAGSHPSSAKRRSISATRCSSSARLPTGATAETPRRPPGCPGRGCRSTSADSSSESGSTAALEPDLALERLPVQHGCGPRVRRELLCLAAGAVRVEDEAACIVALEEHHPDGWASRGRRAVASAICSGSVNPASARASANQRSN